MQSFKHFLNEARVERLSATPLGDDWMEAVEQHCSQALREYREGKAIYKGWYTGDFNPRTVHLLTPGKRKSENTSNQYTRIFDSNPANKSYPKRSESFICATNSEIAKSYGTLNIMLPFDGTAIGVCPTDDIWDVKLTLTDDGQRRMGINEVNDIMHEVLGLDGSVDYNSFMTKISNLTEEELHRLCRTLEFATLSKVTEEQVERIINQWKKLYTYDSQGFKLTHAHDIPSTSHEVWFSAPCIAIPETRAHLLKVAA